MSLRLAVVALAALAALVWAAPNGAQAAAATPRPSSGAEVDDGDGGIEPSEDDLDALPLSQRETRAPAHPDCDDRVPLWEHAVAHGESLGLIAGRYGVRRKDVVALNPQLTNPDHIVPGQKVRVCPEIAPRQRKQVTHAVAAGDTLIGIAKRHGLTVDELQAALAQEPINTAAARLAANPDRLLVGQILTFFVDGGMLADFLPPLPKKSRAHQGNGRSRSGSGRARHRRVDVQLRATDSIHVKRPKLAFGTQQTVRLIKSAVAKYEARRGGGPKVVIGDISRRGGGQIPPHLSHRRGVDVDVGYVLKGEAAGRTRFYGVNRETLDLGRTWHLVKAFLDTDRVVYIFMDYAIQKRLYDYAKDQGASTDELDELFQYPRGRGRSHGIIRHWRSHKNHFHVRFK